MKLYLIGITLWLCPITLFTQNKLEIMLLSATDKNPLIGANVLLLGADIGGSTNKDGMVFLNNIPDGNYILKCSYLGYQTTEQRLSFPIDTAEIRIELTEEHEEMEEVIVSSTRLSRDIAEIPTRIEAIAKEEVEEKINMRPNNVSMLLHESTGIQVQQNNYTTGVLSVRIQGLDGKYAQILKDGFANFGGFGGSMSLLDIPPLDLQQVEIIKGSASTLYGGGAISGMINFISKIPKEKREVSFISNLTSIGGKNLGLFVSHQKGKIGYSLMTSYNTQTAYDVDKDGFSELPKGNEFGVSPQLFWQIQPNFKLRLGLTYTQNWRKGGDMRAFEPVQDNDIYVLLNDANRILSQLDMQYKQWRFKYGYSLSNRTSLVKESIDFKAQQRTHFTEMYHQKKLDTHFLTTGVNFLYDNLEAHPFTDVRQKVVGLYVQDNIDLNSKTALEAGLRTDYAFKDGFFALPRFSILHRLSPKTSLRLGGGLGYKLPSIYSEETEVLGFSNIQPLALNLKAEKSLGTTLDLNYRGIIGTKTTFTFNHLFFLTNIQQPLVLTTRNNFNYLENQQKGLQTAGFETNIRLTFADFIKLFTGYTLTQAQNLATNTFIPLNPKHKFNFALIAEKHGNFKIGLEGYVTGQQYLTDTRLTPSNVEFGLFVEKAFGKISAYINAENFTDSRQNKNEQMVFPPYNNPTFAPIYMHTEGRYMNGGIKFKF